VLIAKVEGSYLIKISDLYGFSHKNETDKLAAECREVQMMEVVTITAKRREKFLSSGLHLKPFNTESGVQLLMFGPLVRDFSEISLYLQHIH
jgi:hypothetical protein